MEVTVHGTRGSRCVSGSQFNRYGGMTSCVLVKTRRFWIVFDAGMGLVEAGQRIMEDRSAPRNVFIFLSHLHNDHTEGIHFFRPLYSGNFTIRVGGFGESSQVLLQRISASFSPPYFPLALSELKSQLETISIGEEEVIVFDDEAGTWRVRNVFRDPFASGDFAISNWYHPSHPRDGSLVFKMNYGGRSIVYASDVELYGGGRDHRLLRICRDAELVFMDAQYSDERYFDPDFVVQGYGHSYHSAAIQFARLARVRRLRFFHHDPQSTDAELDEVDRRLKTIDPAWGCAYAGETIQVI